MDRRILRFYFYFSFLFFVLWHYGYGAWSMVSMRKIHDSEVVCLLFEAQRIVYMDYEHGTGLTWRCEHTLVIGGEE